MEKKKLINLLTLTAVILCSTFAIAISPFKQKKHPYKNVEKILREKKIIRKRDIITNHTVIIKSLARHPFDIDPERSKIILYILVDGKKNQPLELEIRTPELKEILPELPKQD